MSQDNFKSQPEEESTAKQVIATPTHYDLLDLTPGSSVQEIRRAYREKSKLYHPDTTEMPLAIAQEQFHRLNEAYAILSSPERRLRYDLLIGYSRIAVSQPAPSLRPNRGISWTRSSAYLDPSDRPLSPGELFALFILGLTFLGCLLLAVLVGLTRGELVLQHAKLPLFSSQPTPTISPDRLAAPATPDPKSNPRTHFLSPSSPSLSPPLL